MTPEIRAQIEAIDRNKTLHVERNFRLRALALGTLRFHVLERIVSLVDANGPDQALADLRGYAERVKTRLQAIDERLFRTLRGDIAAGTQTPAGLKRQLLLYGAESPVEEHRSAESYDALDAFASGLLLTGPAPEATTEQQPEMVPYQPTPTRIVLELVETADLRSQDVFYDIGSGLGQVAIWVHLLSGVRAKGVEYEPAYCDYARRCVRELNLTGVEFICADARRADVADGTVFFMYTPFMGRMLDSVLERLRDGSGPRGIKLFTYGPCTQQVAQQGWLQRLDQGGDSPFRLAMFQTAHRGHPTQP